MAGLEAYPACVNEPRTTATAWRYLCRAIRLRCPACGISPIFIVVRCVRRLRDWFTPLDGCPRCGYPYEREPGYYLIPIWAINYGVGVSLGWGSTACWNGSSIFRSGSFSQPFSFQFSCSAFYSRATPRRSFWRSICFLIPMRKEGGNDGGNVPAEPRGPLGDDPSRKPEPSCDPGDLVR